MATDSIRTIAPLCRIGFPQIFTPKVENIVDKASGEVTGTPKKWGGQLVFDSSVQAELDKLIEDVKALGVSEFGDNFWQLVEQRSIRWPFRSGGEINPKTSKPRFPEGNAITFVNVSSYSPVSVVSKYCDPADKDRKPVVVTDPEQLWAGQYIRAAVTLKPYRRKDGMGIACYINGVQLWHEGERWGGGFNAQDEFSAEGEMPQAELPPEPPAAGGGEGLL